MTQIIVRENTTDDEILEECRGYAKKCKPGKSDVWLDIGAHIGCFTCIIAPKVKKVIAYEPEPKNYAELLENIKLNGYTNVQAVNAAVVGNDDLERDFYAIDFKNTGVHSFFPRCKENGEATETKIIVQTENINEIIDAFGITAIKMDCEGAEVEILKNLQRWDKIKELIFEYHPTIIPGSKKVMDELIALMHGKFILFKVETRGDVVLVHGRR